MSLSLKAKRAKGCLLGVHINRTLVDAEGKGEGS